MTNEEKLAEEYRKSLWQRLTDEDNFERLEMFDENVEEAFLAGLKAGRPKWHKPSEKLPADCSLVLAFAFEDSEPSLYQFVTSNTWEWMPRRIVFLSNDQIRCWCEIPKYTEE